MDQKGHKGFSNVWPFLFQSSAMLLSSCPVTNFWCLVEFPPILKKKMIEHIQAAWQPVGKCWVLAVWPFDKHLAGEKLGHSKSRANLIHGKCQKICPSMIFHFQFLRENVWLTPTKKYPALGSLGTFSMSGKSSGTGGGTAAKQGHTKHCVTPYTFCTHWSAHWVIPEHVTPKKGRPKENVKLKTNNKNYGRLRTKIV